MPPLRHPSSAKIKRESMGFVFWISRRVGEGVRKGIGQDAAIFSFHTAFSDLDQRILEGKGLWGSSNPPSILLLMKKQSGEGICLEPQLVVDREGPNPFPNTLLFIHWKCCFR